MQPQRQPTSRLKQPGGSRPRPPQPAVNEDGEVEVSAAFMHGPRSDQKAILKVVFFIAMGLAFVTVLYFLVSNLNTGRAEQKRKEKEEVANVGDFESAINKAKERIDVVVKAFPNVDITESNDLSAVATAFATAKNGGAVPWTTPPRPGNPLRSYSYVLKHRDSYKHDHFGYVVVLYYRTAQEVAQAEETLRAQCTTPASFCGYSVNSSLWFACYSGANLGGPVYDAIERIKSEALPVDFKQFQKRVGVDGQG
ncbi:MAG: hypothetical protein IT462_14525 [Planctomycetes bacterium]|nr:hypothetical protein [Planctomycetota bacterium]